MECIVKKSVFLAGCILLCVTQAVQAESYNLNMRNADIGTFIEMISKVTGENFVLDQQVQPSNKINLIGNTEVAAEDLNDVLLSVLSVNGLSMTKTEKVTKIIPSNKSKYQGMPFYSEKEFEAEFNDLELDALITSSMSAKHVPVGALIPILRPMISPTGHLQAFSPSNSVIVTDTVSNVIKVKRIIKSVDLPEDNKIEVVYFRYAQVADVLKVMERLGRDTSGNKTKKYTLSIDTRTNAILVEGSKVIRDHLKTVLRELDIRAKKPAENESADESSDDQKSPKKEEKPIKVNAVLP